MSEQPVVAHSYAQATGDPPQETGDEKGLPGKEEECGNCPGVKQGHEDCGYPVDFVVGGGFAIQSFELHFGWNSPLFRCSTTLTG